MDEGTRQVLMAKRKELGYSSAGEILDDYGIGGKRTVHHMVAQDLARRLAPDAIMCLLDVMKTSDDARAKIVAAQTILDRAYGKVMSNLTVTNVDTGSYSQYSTEDLKRMVFEQLQMGSIDVTPEREP